MLLKIYYMDDFRYEDTEAETLIPDLYRLVDKIPLPEIGDGIFSAAAALVAMSRAPRWHELGRRPIRAGDVLSVGGKNYRYSKVRGRPLKNCSFKLNRLERSILQ